MPQEKTLPRFAVLQLSGCAGCEVSLLNAGEWVDQYELVYMPLVVSAYDVPEDIEMLLVSGGVRTDEDLYNLRRAAEIVERVVAVGTCAISGGVANLGDRDEVREIVPGPGRAAPRAAPAAQKPADGRLCGGGSLPARLPAHAGTLHGGLDRAGDFQASRIVCQECGRKKLKDMRPEAPAGLPAGRGPARISA